MLIKKINITVILVFLCADILAVNRLPTTSEWIKSGTIAALATTTSTALFLVGTPQCYWCKPNKFDEKVGRALALPNLEQTAYLSHIITLGVVPLLALAAAAKVSNSGLDFAFNTIVLFDSALMNLALTQAIKISSRRERPEVYFGFSFVEDRIKNQSFLSGHTSLAFALLTSASVLAIRDKAPWAPYFMAFAASAGLFVGYTRIASGKHWASDVLAGMGLGIALGVSTPLLIFDSQKSMPGDLALSFKPVLINENIIFELSLR